MASFDEENSLWKSCAGYDFNVGSVLYIKASISKPKVSGNSLSISLSISLKFSVEFPLNNGSHRKDETYGIFLNEKKTLQVNSIDNSPPWNMLL